MALQTLSHTLHRTFPSFSLLQEANLLEKAWEDVGGALSKYAQIVAIEKNQLVLESSYSPVIQEIQFRRKELVRKMNQYFSHSHISQITIRPERS